MRFYLYLDKKLGYKCRDSLKFGKDKIKTIGIVSGGAQDFVNQAVLEDLDCI